MIEVKSLYDSIEDILLYHSKNGFINTYKELIQQIEDLRKNKSSEIVSSCLRLAVPSNRNKMSIVEVYIINNNTLSDLEFQTRELSRFIDKLNYIIDNLPYNERTVIKSRYLNKYNKINEFKYVAMHTHFSEDWCEKLNKRALERIAKELNGVKITWE